MTDFHDHMLHSDLDLQTSEKGPCVSNTPRPPLCFRRAVPLSSRCSQSFTSHAPQSRPWRGSLHHKIAMHVNSTVHGSNEPWRWMLSDFKRLRPYAPPYFCLPTAHAFVRNVFTRPAGSEDQSYQIGRRAKSHACTSTCIKDLTFSPIHTSTCARLSRVAALFQSSQKRWTHAVCWQVGCSVKMTGGTCERFSSVVEHHQTPGEWQSLCFPPHSITCSPNGGAMQFSLMNLLQSK